MFRGQSRMHMKLLVPFFAAAAVCATPAFSADKPYCIQPYTADADSAQFAASLTESISKESSWSVLPSVPEKPFLFPDGDAAQEITGTIADAGDDADAERVIAGRVSKSGEWFIIDTCIVSVSDRKIEYTSSLSVSAAEKDAKPWTDIVGRIKFFSENRSFPVVNIAATKGINGAVQVSWDPVKDCALYEILSSAESDSGPFTIAGTSKTPLFTDKESKPGVKTWYAVCPVIEGIRAEQSAAAAGYRKPAFPKDIDLKTLLASFNRPHPKQTKDEAKKAAADIAYIKQWYQNPTKLKLMLFMSKDYLQKKQLYALRGSDDYEFSADGREIRIFPADRSHLIVFKNGTFDRRIAKHGDKSLTDRLMKNSVLFCVPAGDIETTNAEGNAVYIPRFDVITMTSTYYRDPYDWESTTVLYTTVDETLKVQVDREKKKIEDQNAADQ